MRSAFRQSRAQVSIELIIILAAVLAVALILVVQLQKTAVKGSEAVEKQGDAALNQVNSMISCQTGEDCPTDYTCNSATGSCERV
ncbi:MAG: class III signal peptide-containing protein [Candidatus Burarchaeum sp.]|nr:class III signal peptide-containing protein [Candidatus Burarchaeum sp.]MDO8339028.1 class III signal peptide-containing protein [Candidatus Burarchaeum sp.]